MKELFFSALIPSLITALIFGIVLSYILWYDKKHPFSGKVIGKTRRGKNYILIVEDSKQREAKIITNETTWSKFKLGYQYTKKDNDRYYLSG